MTDFYKIRVKRVLDMRSSLMMISKKLANDDNYLIKNSKQK